MQKPEDSEGQKSRPTSRRNSASRRSAQKKSPLNSAPSSATSTPKKQQQRQSLDFCVTGKQILRKDRINSLPASQHQHHRVPVESARLRPDSTVQSQSSHSRDKSLEDDVSLDLSQVSDFEDTSSKYGLQKLPSAATSTPKPASAASTRVVMKSRSASLQTQLLHKVEHIKRSKAESRQSISTFSTRDSLPYKSSSSATNYRSGVNTDLDYSSVSPEYSGQSSGDPSPRNLTKEAEVTYTVSPRSQLNVSSCCMPSWQDEEPKVEEYRRDGEWSFWANYNNSCAGARVPVTNYYDQCPTPYRTEDIELADLDSIAASSKKRSPENLRNINSIIRNEGLHLTPRETQNIIKCAHILGNVLTKAIERRSKEKDLEEENEQTVEVVEVDSKEENYNKGDDRTDEENIDTAEESLKPEDSLHKTEENIERENCTDAEHLPAEYKQIKKKSLTLNLRETALPLEVKEEKRQETVTTQTDISLPNTKSAPKIFEKILRQLSKTSLEESLEKLEKKAIESKELEKKALESRELKKKELEDRELEKDVRNEPEVEK